MESIGQHQANSAVMPFISNNNTYTVVNVPVFMMGQLPVNMNIINNTPANLQKAETVPTNQITGNTTMKSDQIKSEDADDMNEEKPNDCPVPRNSILSKLSDQNSLPYSISKIVSPNLSFSEDLPMTNIPQINLSYSTNVVKVSQNDSKNPNMLNIQTSSNINQIQMPLNVPQAQPVLNVTQIQPNASLSFSQTSGINLQSQSFMSLSHTLPFLNFPQPGLSPTLAQVQTTSNLPQSLSNFNLLQNFPVAGIPQGPALNLIPNLTMNTTQAETSTNVSSMPLSQSFPITSLSYSVFNAMPNYPVSSSFLSTKLPIKREKKVKVGKKKRYILPVQVKEPRDYVSSTNFSNSGTLRQSRIIILPKIEADDKMKEKPNIILGKCIERAKLKPINPIHIKSKEELYNKLVEDNKTEEKSNINLGKCTEIAQLKPISRIHKKEIPLKSKEKLYNKTELKSNITLGRRPKRAKLKPISSKEHKREISLKEKLYNEVAEDNKMEEKSNIILGKRTKQAKLKPISSKEHKKEILKSKEKLYNKVPEDNKTEEKSNIALGKCTKRAKTICSKKHKKEIPIKSKEELYNKLAEDNKTEGKSNIALGKSTKRAKLKPIIRIQKKEIPIKSKEELYNKLAEDNKTEEKSNITLGKCTKTKLKPISQIQKKEIPIKSQEELYNKLAEDSKTEEKSNITLGKCTKRAKLKPISSREHKKEIALKCKDKLYNKVAKDSKMEKKANIILEKCTKRAKFSPKAHKKEISVKSKEKLYNKVAEDNKMEEKFRITLPIKNKEQIYNKVAEKIKTAEKSNRTSLTKYKEENYNKTRKKPDLILGKFTNIFKLKQTSPKKYRKEIPIRSKDELYNMFKNSPVFCNSSQLYVIKEKFENGALHWNVTLPDVSLKNTGKVPSENNNNNNINNENVRTNYAGIKASQTSDENTSMHYDFNLNNNNSNEKQLINFSPTDSKDVDMKNKDYDSDSFKNVKKMDSVIEKKKIVKHLPHSDTKESNNNNNNANSLFIDESVINIHNISFSEKSTGDTKFNNCAVENSEDSNNGITNLQKKIYINHKYDDLVLKNSTKSVISRSGSKQQKDDIIDIDNVIVKNETDSDILRRESKDDICSDEMENSLDKDNKNTKKVKNYINNMLEVEEINKTIEKSYVYQSLTELNKLLQKPDERAVNNENKHLTMEFDFSNKNINEVVADNSSQLRKTYNSIKCKVENYLGHDAPILNLVKKIKIEHSDSFEDGSFNENFCFEKDNLFVKNIKLENENIINNMKIEPDNFNDSINETFLNCVKNQEEFLESDLIIDELKDEKNWNSEITHDDQTISINNENEVHEENLKRIQECVSSSSCKFNFGVKNIVENSIPSKKFNLNEKCDNKTLKSRKTYKCIACNMKFKLRKFHLEHILLHTGGKTFSCELCCMEFSYKFKLAVHNDKYHPTSIDGKSSYKCVYCEKTFKHRHLLLNHKSTHTGIHPYFCDGCGDIFSNNNQLIDHRIKSQEQPYPCEDCDKKFSWKSQLRVHQKVHKTFKGFVFVSC